MPAHISRNLADPAIELRASAINNSIAAKPSLMGLGDLLPFLLPFLGTLLNNCPLFQQKPTAAEIKAKATSLYDPVDQKYQDEALEGVANSCAIQYLKHQKKQKIKPKNRRKLSEIEARDIATCILDDARLGDADVAVEMFVRDSWGQQEIEPMLAGPGGFSEDEELDEDSSESLSGKLLQKMEDFYADRLLEPITDDMLEEAHAAFPGAEVFMDSEGIVVTFRVSATPLAVTLPPVSSKVVSEFEDSVDPVTDAASEDPVVTPATPETPPV